MFQAAEGVDLRFANKIYTASGLEVKTAYKDLTSRTFSSASQEVDFGNPANAATIINNWCSEQTKNRIKNIIDPGKLKLPNQVSGQIPTGQLFLIFTNSAHFTDSLDPRSQMILVNAVYFNGKWEYKFNSASTEDRPFHTDEKSTRNVPTMWIKQDFRHGDLPEMNAKFIEIPYDVCISRKIKLKNEQYLYKTNFTRILEVPLYNRLSSAFH